MEEAFGVRARGQRMAAAGERRTLLRADLDVLHDRLPLLGADQRSHLRTGIEAFADAQRPRTRHESIEKRAIHPLVNDDAARRRAALAGRPEATPQAAFDGEVEIRIVHHHDDVLAAHLQVNLLERRRSFFGHRAPDVGRSGERDDPHVVVDEHRAANIATATRHQVDDASRETGLFENPDEVQRRKRRQRGRLENDRVAAHQRRDDLPRWNRHRKIPRCDDRAHAQGLPHGHRELVSQFGRHGLPVLPPPLAGHEEGHVDGLLDVAARLVQHLPHFPRHVAGERLFAIRESAGAAQGLARRRRHEAPVLVGPLGRVDRPCHVCRGRFLEDADQIVGVFGISILERLS